tara:strand:- start:41 stop:298 length:258 start_codon:yes stop_codon:yes gene_type:complete
MVLKRMIGGGLEKASKEVTKKMGKNGELYMFFLGILMLILKTLMVQWAYNKIWPKLMVNSGQNVDNFKPLDFNEALLVVILFMFI